MRFEHRFQTNVALPADAAWTSATTLDGIVAELPRAMRLRTEPAVSSLADLPAGDSTIVATLCIGRIPVLRWSPGLERLDVEARTFVETSTDMTWMPSWRHERRIIELDGDTSRIEDLVSGSSPLPLAGMVVGWLFRARHRRLRRAATSAGEASRRGELRQRSQRPRR